MVDGVHQQSKAGTPLSIPKGIPAFTAANIHQALMTSDPKGRHPVFAQDIGRWFFVRKGGGNFLLGRGFSGLGWGFGGLWGFGGGGGLGAGAVRGGIIPHHFVKRDIFIKTLHGIVATVAKFVFLAGADSADDFRNINLIGGSLIDDPGRKLDHRAEQVVVLGDGFPGVEADFQV